MKRYDIHELKDVLEKSCYETLLIDNNDIEIRVLKECLENNMNCINGGLMISIIISTHNRINILPRTILGIMQQSYKNYEIIIVDDSDNNDTENYFKHLNTSKIRYFKEKQNYGGGISKKTGYLNAQGDIIIFSDDDDYYIDSRYFEKIVEKFKDKKYNLLISNTITLYENEGMFELNKLNFKHELTNKDYFNGFHYKYTKPTSMFPLAMRKSALDSIKYENLKFFGDTSLYLYGLLSDGYVGVLNEYSGIYRVQSKSVTAKSRAEFIVTNFESKKDIFDIALKKDYFTIDPDKWLYSQLMINVVWHFNSKVNPLSEDNKLLKWCGQNLKGKYRIRIILKICLYNLKNRVKHIKSFS